MREGHRAQTREVGMGHLIYSHVSSHQNNYGHRMKGQRNINGRKKKIVSSLFRGPEVGPCITQLQSRTRVVSKICVYLLLSNIDSVVDRSMPILNNFFETKIQ